MASDDEKNPELLSIAANQEWPIVRVRPAVVLTEVR